MDTAVTAPVVTVKVAPIAPAGTVTLDGTLADGPPLDSDTVAPPAGASPFNITVPVEVAPPVTLFGLNETPETAGGFTIRIVAAVRFNVPEIVTGVGELTGIVVTVNVAVVAPAATVTLAGTSTAALLLESVTVCEDDIALLIVTVPIEEVPPVAPAGLILTEAIHTPDAADAEPTLVVGSAEAYWRKRKSVTEATAFPQPISPKSPLEKVASVAVMVGTPLMENT